MAMVGSDEATGGLVLLSHRSLVLTLWQSCLCHRPSRLPPQHDHADIIARWLAGPAEAKTILLSAFASEPPAHRLLYRRALATLRLLPAILAVAGRGSSDWCSRSNATCECGQVGTPGAVQGTSAVVRGEAVLLGRRGAPRSCEGNLRWSDYGSPSEDVHCSCSS